MPRVFGDPEELRNFAKILNNYIENLETETGNLIKGMQDLENSWNDSKSQQFIDDFNELIVSINRFKDSASEKIPHLLRLAEDLESYLNK